MIVAVADTGPIIHLAEIDALDLLRELDRLLVPEAVYAELEAGGVPDGLGQVQFERVESNPCPETEFPELDPGEKAALSLARDRNVILLTDDLEARDAAATVDVEVHGSIGLVALAYAGGSLSKAAATDLMRALQSETSLFVTDAVVERGIALLERDT